MEVTDSIREEVPGAQTSSRRQARPHSQSLAWGSQQLCGSWATPPPPGPLVLLLKCPNGFKQMARAWPHDTTDSREGPRFPAGSNRHNHFPRATPDTQTLGSFTSLPTVFSTPMCPHGLAPKPLPPGVRPGPYRLDMDSLRPLLPL